MDKKISIIGSGSWGVALAILLNNNGYNPYIWSFAKEEADSINQKRECVFLPGIKLDENIKCSTDIELVVKDSDIILMVVPSKFYRDNIKNIKPYVKEGASIIICSKGLEDETLYTLSQVTNQELPNNKVGILSGPSHAEEVARNLPTTIVLCSEDDELLKKLQDIFSSALFRVYTSKDVIGVEVGGALKNIIALSTGIAKGLGYGDNIFAAIITRGLKELVRIGDKLDCTESTFYGLSGLGDLIVTCLSEHSRNTRAGVYIGQGMTVEEATKKVGMVVESINTTKVAKKIIDKYDVEAPIINEVYNILFEGKDPKECAKELMTREKKSE